MKRDCHGVVTRDITRRSRVSHATTTTPHHTMVVVTSACGCSNHLCIASSLSDQEPPASMHAMNRGQK